MTQNDIVGLILSYAYVAALIIIATLTQKWRGYQTEFTRKIIHIGAGMWIVGAVAIFDHWYIGIIPISTFIVMNYISNRKRLIDAMDLAGDTAGTVYFPLAVTVLLLIFWPRDQVYIAVAGTMAMTWGDAFAAIIGKTYGKKSYTVQGHRRTFEGSTAMFAFSFLAIALTLLLMKAELGLEKIVLSSVLLAIIAVILEAFSLKGMDNLTVPFGTSFSLWALISWDVNFSMIFLGLIMSALIGVVAYRKKSLSESGVAGAMLVGTLIFGFGGWVWGLTLIAFFVYGSLLSKYKEVEKNLVAAEKFDKGSRRDFGQALANGGVGAVLAVLFFVYPSQEWLFAAFIGTMATVNADTWATEIGVLSKHPPRFILNGKPVPPGTSGGITPIGTLATILGGLLIGITVWVLQSLFSLLSTGHADLLSQLWMIPAGTAGGLAGSLFDSLLGATVQAMYINPETGKETEKKVARNGVKNRFSRGLPFMDNDLVNFVSSIFGAGVAVVISMLFK
ncbi:DUF92 domain-containing protein [Heliobacterium chlorum]|nr:DUF92 domain-containing protein [Heliobacterium chlorum]